MEKDQAKLFVGGISRDTSEETFKEYFGKYGDVLWSLVAKDRNTGVPRGFGFVSFSEVSAANDALRDSHVILGRTVEVKKAIPKSEQQVNRQQQQRNTGLGAKNDGCNNCCGFSTRKIFVGGLPASLTEDEFKGYFERFGRITDVVVMHDVETNRPRGFGFITFDKEESVENVMKTNFYDLNGRFVEVKRAVPKDVNRSYGGVGSSYNNFVPVTYPAYSPGAGFIPSYGPFPGYSAFEGYLCGTSVYGCGYSMGGYGSYGYGYPMFAPRSPWNQPSSLGLQGCVLPYSSAFVYPSCANTSVRITGNANSANNVGAAVSERFNKDEDANRLVPADGVQPQVEGEMLNVDSSGFKGSEDAASRKVDHSSSNGRS